MKMRYCLLFVLISGFALSGCHNRFEEYEPYSYFDERMAEESRPAGVPDDQMPPEVDDQYAYNYSSTAPVARQYQSNPVSQAPVRSVPNAEVPFDASRSKHAANIGGM